MNNKVNLIESFRISLPSQIGRKCDSGDVDDCNLSLTTEIVPFSCKSRLILSTNKNDACGAKCNNSQPRNDPKKRGWTQFRRFV